MALFIGQGQEATSYTCTGNLVKSV